MRITLLISLLVLVAACGQKGNLYLPEDDPYAPGATAEQNCRSRTCKPVEAAGEATADTPEQPATITLEPQPEAPSQAPSQETQQ